MFYSAFDHLLPATEREDSKGSAGLLPLNLRDEIDEMNQWVYDTVRAFPLHLCPPRPTPIPMLTLKVGEQRSLQMWLRNDPRSL